MRIKENSSDDEAKQQDDPGMTPLQYLLEQKGAGRGLGVKSLLEAASIFGTEEIVKALLQAGAKENRAEEQPPQKDDVNDLFSEIVDKVLVKTQNKGKGKAPTP